MIEETATVNSVEDDWVEVTSEIKSTCSSCQQIDSCGSGQVAKAFPQKNLSLRLPTKDFKPSLKVGDKVIIAIPQGRLMSSLARVYGLPLLFLIMFSGIGQITIAQSTHEIFSILFGFIGGYLGFRLAKYIENQKNNQTNLAPYLLKKIPSSDIDVQIHSA